MKIENKEKIYLPRFLLKIDDIKEVSRNEANPLFFHMTERKLSVDLSAFRNYFLTFIVGEAGLGKTELLDFIINSSTEYSFLLKNLNLKEFDFSNNILEFITKPEIDNINEKSVYLFLDGLDEINQQNVLILQQNIYEIFEKKPNWKLIITSRTALLERYKDFFLAYTYQILQLISFSDDDVLTYMEMVDINPSVIELARKDWLNLFRGTNLIRVPRYLNYICEYLKEHKNYKVQNIPRLSEVFQNIIDKELKHEVSKKGLVANSRVVERLLSKLALSMEISQTNSITGDELLTFFDNIKSDLKISFLNPDDFITLTEFILKFDGNRYEFQNRELQEFLAATELIRLDEPQRVIFSLCYDKDSRALKPSWAHCLGFVFDLKPELFIEIVPYLIAISSESGKTSYKLDESFWRIAPIFKDTKIDAETRRKVFKETFSYFNNIPYWINYDAVFFIVSIYDESFEETLLNFKENISEIESQARIEKGNLARLIGEVRNKGSNFLSDYWQQWLLGLIEDPREDAVVVRMALWAIRYFKDVKVIEKLELLSKSEDSSIREAISEVCRFIDPDSQKSIEINLKLFLEKVIGSFSALSSCRKLEGQIFILEKIASSEDLIEEFLKQLENSSSLKKGFWSSILFRKIENASLEKAVRELIVSIIPVLGRENYIHRSVYEIMQKFSIYNFNITEFVVSFYLKTLSNDDYWDVVSGLPYIIPKEKYAEIISWLKESGKSNDMDYFISSLNSQFSRFKLFSESKNNVDDEVIPEVFKIDEALFIELDNTGIDARKNFIVFDKISNLLNQFSQKKKKIDNLDLHKLSLSIENRIFTLLDPKIEDIIFDPKNPNTLSFKNCNIALFSTGVDLCVRLAVNFSSYREKFISFLPFAEGKQIKWLFNQINELNELECDQICTHFISNPAFKIAKIHTFMEIVPFLKTKDLSKNFTKFILDSEVDPYHRIKLLDELVKLNMTEVQLDDINKVLKEEKNEYLDEKISNLYISKYNSRTHIENRINEIIARVGEIPQRKPYEAFRPTNIEDEMWENSFAQPLLDVADPNMQDLFFKLLTKGFDLAEQEDRYFSYASYMWKIVIKYIQNLLVLRSYKPLKDLEQKIAENFHKERSNWIQSMLTELRSTYSSYLSKPSSFHASVKLYNLCYDMNNIQITNVTELTYKIRDSITERVKDWIQGEGKKIILSEYDSAFHREVALQKLIKLILVSDLNIFASNQCPISVIREPQLDDDSRTDLLISYGFIGPVVIELKLASNRDITTGNLETSKSYTNLVKYMNGYRCSSGIFLVLLDKEISTEQEQRIRNAYGKIAGLAIVIISLPNEIISEKSNTKKAEIKK